VNGVWAHRKGVGSTAVRGIKLKFVVCPDCDAEINVPDDVVVGDLISCPVCGLELEVKSVCGDCVEVEELQLDGEDWGE